MLTWSPLPSVSVIVESYSVSILWERSCWFPKGLGKLTFPPSGYNGSLCTHPHQNSSLFVVWVTFLLTEMRQNFNAVLFFFLSQVVEWNIWPNVYRPFTYLFRIIFMLLLLIRLFEFQLFIFFIVLDIFYKLFLYKIFSWQRLSTILWAVSSSNNCLLWLFSFNFIRYPLPIADNTS